MRQQSRGRILVGFGACLVSAVIVLAGSSAAVAQEWSAAQKDVWKSVEAYWDLGAKRDVDGMLGYFHDSYLGWSNQSPLPNGKAEVRKWMTHEFETTTEVLHTIQPVGIAIHGDMAIVHYYFVVLETNAKGEEQTRQGRWTDILKKQGDRWVLVADHGGQASGN